MKRILFVLALIALVAGVDAQRFTAKEYFKLTGAAGDTAISGSNKSIVFEVTRNDMYLYCVEAEVDEISGSANAIVKLYGSNDNSHYYLIDTLTTELASAGTEALTADGTVGLKDLSTGLAWRYLKAELVLSTTGKWDFNYLIFRAVGKND